MMPVAVSGSDHDQSGRACTRGTNSSGTVRPVTPHLDRSVPARWRGRMVKAEHMSGTSSEQNTGPAPSAVKATRFDVRPEPIDESALEIVGNARAQLIEVEMMLRDLWYTNVDSGPALSARLSIAARLAHNAAEALSPQTLV